MLLVLIVGPIIIVKTKNSKSNSDLKDIIKLEKHGIQIEPYNVTELSKENKKLFFNAYENYLENDNDSGDESEEMANNRSNSENDENLVDIDEEKSLNQSNEDNNLYQNIDIDEKSNELENQITNEKKILFFFRKKENNDIINSKLTYGF